MAVNSTKAIFIDKDGTLIENVPFNIDPAKIRLQKGAEEALLSFTRLGYRLIVISNQSGVAQGRFAESALAQVEERLRELMNECGAVLDGFYYCPHHPEGTNPRYRRGCNCRKPAPGMLIQAAHDLGIDLSHSWMIGDILDDIEAGNRAGCNSILLMNGGETAWCKGPFREPTYVASTLREAAGHIHEYTHSSAELVVAL